MEPHVIFLRVLLGPDTEVAILDGTRVQLPLIVPSVRSVDEGPVLSSAPGRGTQNNAWWNRSRELLHSILSLDPTTRPGAQQALWHPCFNVSIAADSLSRRGNFVTQENKIRRLQKDIALMVMPDVQPWMMMVKRDPAPQLVKGALMQFYRRKTHRHASHDARVFCWRKWCGRGWIARICSRPSSRGSPVHPILCAYLSGGRGGRGCLPKRICGADASMVGLEETHMTQSERLKLFEGLGRALLKALMDQITIPCRSAFAPSLFRFLLRACRPWGYATD